jgi:NAD(P)-dependent dehydrogenase (short-subunit alcohol dehydrogenase family)
MNRTLFQNDTLADQRILITGGGSGLGLAMAKHFAALGAAVAICGRNAEKLERAASDIAASGGKVCYFPVDVRDYDRVAELIDFCNVELGPLTGLVNNAAGNFICASEDLTPKGFKAVVDIVLHGTFNCSHILGKYWIDNQLPGHVLNIVTTYTESGSAFVLPSACAKAGVLALSNSLAFEWGTYGLRFNAIAPGPFPTPGAWSRLLPDARFEELMLRNNPSGRVGKHEELAYLAAFLFSPFAAYINGACIPIDGGERLNGAQFSQYAQTMDRATLKELFRQMRQK